MAAVVINFMAKLEIMANYIGTQSFVNGYLTRLLLLLFLLYNIKLLCSNCSTNDFSCMGGFNFNNYLFNYFASWLYLIPGFAARFNNFQGKRKHTLLGLNQGQNLLISFLHAYQARPCVLRTTNPLIARNFTGAWAMALSQS